MPPNLLIFSTFVSGRDFDDRAWVGATNKVDASVWRWESGRKILVPSKDLWGDNQPSDPQNQNCLAILGEDFKYHDTFCEEEHRYLCSHIIGEKRTRALPKIHLPLIDLSRIFSCSSCVNRTGKSFLALCPTRQQCFFL